MSNSNRREVIYIKYMSDLNSELKKEIKGYKDLLGYYKENEKEMKELLNKNKKKYMKLYDYVEKSIFISTQNFIWKNFEQISQTKKSLVLKDIYKVLSKPLTTFFNKINCKLNFLIIENNDKSIYIDFKNLKHRANIGEININKFINFDNMTEKQFSLTKQTLFTVNSNFIADRAYYDMTVNNPTTISLDNINILKRKLNNETVYKVCLNFKIFISFRINIFKSECYD